MTAFEELLRSHPNVTVHDIRRLSTPGNFQTKKTIKTIKQ